jgi:hypothetical protein
MEIPSEGAYEKSMQALPGTYKKWTRYTGGNILSLITDMSMSSSCDGDGGLDTRGHYGSRWSASPVDGDNARDFGFNGNGGLLIHSDRSIALPVRPVLK